MIGANGAGKTTLLHAMSGLLKKSGGEVEFLGQSITKIRMPANIVKRRHNAGAGRAEDFPRYERCGKPLDGRLSCRKDKAGIKADLERCMPALPAAGRSACKQLAGTLSGGEQQMLAIGPN